MPGVLDEDLDDTLINVNIVDDEKAAKNVENKKKKPGYQAYDDSEFDEYGTVCNECLDALLSYTLSFYTIEFCSVVYLWCWAVGSFVIFGC